MKHVLAIAVAALVGLCVVPGALAVPRELTSEPTIYDGLRYCPSGQLIVNVTQSVWDDGDVGAAGNVWAYENYTRQIAVFKLGWRTYCAASNYSGWFWSVPGTSPGGSSTIDAGVTGTIIGGWRTSLFTAKWRPTAPTSGSIAPSYGGYGDWDDLYFDDLQGYNLALWSYTYNGGEHGAWLNRSIYGNQGEIS
jgi:hypothetical protein